MKSLEELDQKPKRNLAGLFVGGVVGLVLLGLGIWILTLQPSIEEQKVAVIEGAYKEGSPEFETLTNDIVIATSRDTVESPNAFGTISMFIRGTVRNKGTRSINGLEINVAVRNTEGQVVKEKRLLAIPAQHARLDPGESVTVNLTIDGFKQGDDRADIRWKVTAIRTETPL
jgi:hypothetical protein